MSNGSNRWYRGMIGVAGLLSAAGCASAPAPKPTYQVGASVAAPPSLPPATSAPVVQASGNAGGPPTMAPTQPSIVGMPSARVNISANNEDVSAVISRMARQLGLAAVIDPDVRGPVTRTLQNVSLSDAMASLVGNQFQYQVRGGALVVSPVQLVHHTYTVDYLAMSRFTSGSTVVSRGTQTTTSGTNPLVSSGTGIGTGVSSSIGGGMVASGADVIQSSSNADVWGELTQQLESILFGSSTDSLQRASVATGLFGSGPRGYTRCEGRTCLRISPLTSLVDVTAAPEKQEEVNRYISLFSAAISRQVLIKAQVVEVSLDRQHNFGIDWQAVLSTAQGIIRLRVNPGGEAFNTDPNSSVTGSTASFNLGIGDFTLQAVLDALQSIGDVEVVAKPTTNAMNQQRASFNVTRQEQFFSTVSTPVAAGNNGNVTFQESQQIQTATVGLVFDVIPQISDDNVITMAIRPSLTSIASRDEIRGANGAILATLPVTEHREADTMARVRSGETIMIGGLIQKQSESVRTGIPGLMSLPLIGRAFTSVKIRERSSELVIFLTPEIVSGQPPVGR